MATTFDSVQRAQTLTTPHTLNDPTEQGGVLRCNWATIETTTDHDDTDVISWFTIPANSRVVGGWLAYDDETATITLTVGDATDPDGWLKATLIDDGPSCIQLPNDKLVAVVGAYWVADTLYTADTVITSTYGVTNATGSATLTLCMWYMTPA